MIDGHRIQVNRCRPSQKRWSFGKLKECNKLFVNNLSANVEKTLLRCLFAQFGDIIDLRVVRRPVASFAYIQYEKDVRLILDEIGICGTFYLTARMLLLF